MGSGASKLICPKDYDAKKFNMILKLYDRLDSNGDQIIENSELKDIANLHIENIKKFIINDSLQKKLDYEQKIIDANKMYNYQMNEMEINFKRKLGIIQNQKCSSIYNSNQKLKTLDGMNADDKCNTFLKVVSNKKHIDFWKFFEYMQDKTGDIKNIDL